MIKKCPFLEELSMVFCNVCKTKKMLPKDQLTLENSCETDYYNCPVFQEFLKSQKKEDTVMAQVVKTSKEEKPCIWMKAGVIAHRMCTSNYDCKNCEFDQAITEQSDIYTGSSLVAQATKKLRNLPVSERKCRYMLTGDFFHKLCPNEYECWHCTVDQFVQDIIDAHPYLRKRRERMAKRVKKVKGFTFREDFYYLPNHIWIKVEGETLKIGIDDFASRLIGKVEKIEIPTKGRISKGEKCWRIGSSRRTVAMSLPIEGEIIEKNGLIESEPSIVQKDPYNQGWILKIKSPKQIGDMMKGSKVEEWLEKEFEKLHQEVEKNTGVTITDGGEVVENLCERLTDEEWSGFIKRFLC